MTTKNAKTVLFASLIAAMILPFSGMNFAEANMIGVDTEFSNEKVAFLETATSQTGKWTETKTNGEYTETWYWDVKENNNKKHVQLNIKVIDGQGNQVADDLIKFKVKFDKETNTYEVDNEKLNETKKFKKSQSNSITNSVDTIVIDSSKFAEIDGLVIPGTPLQVVGQWTNPVVASGNEFGSDSYSTCGNSWYVDFQTNGGSGLRHYDYAGQYNWYTWCIFPTSISNVQIYASQGGWSESDWLQSHASTHTEYDIDMDDSLFMKTVWRY